MNVEICCNSIDSALNAQQAGANRIELCMELAVGGVTPSYGLLKKTVEDLSIPVNVLIRPRGGDFTYSDQEFDVMLRDIEFCKKSGCNGIVSGILDRDQKLDKERTKALVEASGALQFTFHRAFDWIVDPFNALNDLMEIGVHTILTSGQENNIEKGMENLIAFQKHCGNRLQIMPGGGINEGNISTFKELPFSYIHFSGTELETRLSDHQPVQMNSVKFFDERVVAVSSIERIKKLIIASKV